MQSKHDSAKSLVDEQLPPAPHNPAERSCVSRVAGWEIRCFARNDAKHEYMAPRGMLHLQVWCPSFNVSILTPSAMTGGLF